MRTTTNIPWQVFVLITAATAGTSLAAPWYELAKVTASDGQASGQFGHSTAVDGGYAVVGAFGSGGGAYVQKRTGTVWSESAKLTPSDGGGSFGFSVSIDGGTILVGATNAKGHGQAYVFDRAGTSWMETAVLAPESGGYFGCSVDIEGNCAIIGDKLFDGQAGDSAGAAYVFRNAGGTWSQEAKLEASDAGEAAWFGETVSISGDFAVVGSPKTHAVGDPPGEAYVFHNNGQSWEQVAKLTSPEAQAEDGFGRSVSIGGDRLIVGAPLKDEGEWTNAGAAYVYRREGETWVQEAKLSHQPEPAGAFGWSVAMCDGDLAMVGVPSCSGVAYIYERTDTSWPQAARVRGSDTTFHDSFGMSVAIDWTSAWAGAPNDDDLGESSGSAYIFAPEPASLALLALGGLAVIRRRRQA